MPFNDTHAQLQLGKRGDRQRWRDGRTDRETDRQTSADCKSINSRRIAYNISLQHTPSSLAWSVS